VALTRMPVNPVRQYRAPARASFFGPSLGAHELGPLTRIGHPLPTSRAAPLDRGPWIRPRRHPLPHFTSPFRHPSSRTADSDSVATHSSLPTSQLEALVIPAHRLGSRGIHYHPPQRRGWSLPIFTRQLGAERSRLPPSTKPESGTPWSGPATRHTRHRTLPGYGDAEVTSSPDAVRCRARRWRAPGPAPRASRPGRSGAERCRAAPWAAGCRARTVPARSGAR